MKISFVIPVFNEEQNLPILISKIQKETNKLRIDSYEIIFVNDGSTDNSYKVLRKFVARNKKIKLISFRKNLGKSVALNEGFRKAIGDIVVTMDSDLQDDPENLGVLLDELNKGSDLVVGWKKVRHDPIDKTFPSKLFNTTVRTFSGILLHDFNSGFKVMKKQVAKELILYGELHRFIPVLAHQKGFSIREVPINHHRRIHGSSKYGFSRILKGFFDFFTVFYMNSFNNRPLHFFGPIGLFGISLGTIFGIYLSVIHFQGQSIGRRPLLILAVLLVVAGLQMLSTGLLAEMVTKRRYDEQQPPIDFES